MFTVSAGEMPEKFSSGGRFFDFRDEWERWKSRTRIPPIRSFLGDLLCGFASDHSEMSLGIVGQRFQKGGNDRFGRI